MSGHRATPLIRAAALAYLALGTAFGVAAALTVDHLRRVGELPMTPFGFRSLGGGPFEALTSEQFRALGWALVGVCALDVVTAARLSRGRRDGAVLGLLTTPVALILAIGFALPILIVGIPVRVALLVAGRSSLR